MTSFGVFRFEYHYLDGQPDNVSTKIDNIFPKKYGQNNVIIHDNIGENMLKYNT